MFALYFFQVLLPVSVTVENKILLCEEFNEIILLPCTVNWNPVLSFPFLNSLYVQEVSV